MLLALVFSLSMASAAPVAPPTVATVKRKNPDNETVCIVAEPVGSHLPHKYCAPRSYWEARTAADQRGLSAFYNGGPNGAGGSGGKIAPSSGGGSGH